MSRSPTARTVATMRPRTFVLLRPVESPRLGREPEVEGVCPWWASPPPDTSLDIKIPRWPAETLTPERGVLDGHAVQTPTHSVFRVAPVAASDVPWQLEPRRLIYRRLVASGALPAGYASEDGVGLHYVGPALRQAVTIRPGSKAWWVEADGSGGHREEPLTPRQI
jgi:hypothetical protein